MFWRIDQVAIDVSKDSRHLIYSSSCWENIFLWLRKSISKHRKIELKKLAENWLTRDKNRHFKIYRVGIYSIDNNFNEKCFEYRLIDKLISLFDKVIDWF